VAEPRAVRVVQGGRLALAVVTKNRVRVWDFCGDSSPPAIEVVRGWRRLAWWRDAPATATVGGWRGRTPKDGEEVVMGGRQEDWGEGRRKGIIHYP
jgi:hypothetical protein